MKSILEEVNAQIRHPEERELIMIVKVLIERIQMKITKVELEQLANPIQRNKYARKLPTRTGLRQWVPASVVITQNKTIFNRFVNIF